MKTRSSIANHASEMADDLKDVAADTLGTVGDVVEFHAAEAGSDAVSAFAHKAREKVDAAADYVDNAEAGEIASDAAHFAKKLMMPLAIAAGVVIVGALASYLFRRV